MINDTAPSEGHEPSERRTSPAWCDYQGQIGPDGHGEGSLATSRIGKGALLMRGARDAVQDERPLDGRINRTHADRRDAKRDLHRS